MKKGASHQTSPLVRLLATAGNLEGNSKWRPSEAIQLKPLARGRTSGSPVKTFQIASKAGKKYGSKAAGKRVAGAILAKQRAKSK
jgi:hypothetical protein